MLFSLAPQIEPWLVNLFLLTTRAAALLMTAPLFSLPNIPFRIKAALALLLGYFLSGIPAFAATTPPDDLGLAVMAQILIGAVLGFVAKLVLTAVEMAGEYISVSAGLSMATMYDPVHSQSSPVIAQFLGITYMLVFLGLAGHLFLIEALIQSFYLLPVNGAWPAFDWKGLVLILSELFRLGLLVSLPAVISLLVFNIMLGVVTRVAPQLHLFAIGFPITIGVSLFAIYLSLDVLVVHTQPYMQQWVERVLAMLGATN